MERTLSMFTRTKRIQRSLLIGPALAGIALMFTAGSAMASHSMSDNGATLHWQTNSGGTAYVYWSDKTSASWPVYTEAVAWDQASGIDALYVSGSNSCTSGHCVVVNEAALSGNCTAGVVGQTTVAHYSSGHFTPGMTVHVANACTSQPYNGRRALLCHEMGHSIGLNDVASTSSSCMRTNAASLGSVIQNSHDYAQLGVIYGHND